MAARLPDGCFIYYGPDIGAHNPDFILLSPRLGLILADVRDWLPTTTISSCGDTITLTSGSRSKSVPHPARIATAYLTHLANTFDAQASESPGLWMPLIHQTGSDAGRLRVPVNRIVVLPNIPANDGTVDWAGEGRGTFNGATVIAGAVFAEWERLSGRELQAAIGAVRAERFEFDALRGREIDVIRGAIRPEIVINSRRKRKSAAPAPSFFDTTATISVSSSLRALAAAATAPGTSSVPLAPLAPAAAQGAAAPNPPSNLVIAPTPRQQPTLLDCLRESWANRVKVLTTEQERAVSSIVKRGGHHRIVGPPGSGKTIVLVRAAIRLADLYRGEQRPSVLLLTYNKGIGGALREMVASAAGDLSAAIEVKTFHAFVRDHYGVALVDKETEAEFAARVEAAIAQHRGEGGSIRHYRAVLVDEYQTWDGSWLRCASAHLDEGEAACFVLAGDGGQQLYGRGRFSLRSVGFNAHNSRTHKLNENRRCPREIQTLAALFAKEPPAGQGGMVGGAGGAGDIDLAEIEAIPPNVATALQAGYLPRIGWCRDKASERAEVVETVREALAGRWRGEPLADGPLDPADIGILYPGLRRGADASRHILALEAALAQIAPTTWITRRDRAAKAGGDAITIQTIHHATGLEYRLVILIDAELLPWRRDTPSDDDKMLMYVALTRSTELLSVAWTRTGSSYTRQISAAYQILAIPGAHVVSR